jgi:hypothetical protein
MSFTPTSTPTSYVILYSLYQILSCRRLARRAWLAWKEGEARQERGLSADASSLAPPHPHAFQQNKTNYLLTPSPQGDLCVAKLFPPSKPAPGAASDPGHGASRASRSVRCEASRELKWSIENTGVRSPIYKIVNKDDTPLYQISKPNPNADFWTMFYYAYAGHQIPPRRAEVSQITLPRSQMLLRRCKREGHRLLA